MLDLDISGIDQFLTELEVEHRALNAYVNVEYRRLVEIVFSDILQATPEWSGNLVANWFVGINSQNATEETIVEKGAYWPPPKYDIFEPYSRQDPNQSAIDVSLRRLHDVDAFSYLDDVYIYNPAFPAEEVEAQTIYIRPVNLLGLQNQMMIAWAYTKYESYNPLT